MNSFAYAMSQSPQAVPGQPAPSPLAGMLPIFLIFAIFYFLLIRPQQKQQKKHQELLSQLKKNDEVVTNGGIHGTIVNVDDATVTLRVDDNTRIKFQKNTISYIKKRQE
ncbi:MAG: preprotein translocase subunit YajC [Candidatus Omnitrophica bacterium]|nr:preprotein translocase subunit YajC [Candidatus Omnitrophota bacterium]